MQTPALAPTRFSLAKSAFGPLARALFFAVALLGAGRALAVDRNLMLFVDHGAMPQIVARGAELAAAETAAKQQRGCFAIEGEGPSMEPVYVGRTGLVVKTGGFENLRAGQAVVYKNSRGVYVTHMIVEKTPYGWVVAGLNNYRQDDDQVTEFNFVGVVTQAFASKSGSLPRAVAARLALNEQVRNGAKVASAGM